MNASLAIAQLRALRVDVSVSPTGKLHVEAPVGTLTNELRSMLVEQREELIAALSARRLPHGPGHDPRPDLTEDADLWVPLLDDALAIDGGDGDGVYWALLGARCMGAELGVTREGALRLRPRPGADADYAVVRPHLVRNTSALIGLLQAHRTARR